MPLLIRDHADDAPALVNYFPLDYGIQVLTAASRVVPCSYWMKATDMDKLKDNEPKIRRYRARWSLNITVLMQIYERTQDSVSKQTLQNRAEERRRMGVSMEEMKRRKAYGILHEIE